MFSKELIAFCQEAGLKADFPKGSDRPQGFYGAYNKLNISFADKEDGTLLTSHNKFTSVKSLEETLTVHKLCRRVSVNGRNNLEVKIADDKYPLKRADYKWILDSVLEFVEKFNLPIGNCESCGRGGAVFYKDVKEGNYFCLCETCKSNVRSEFNRMSGERTGFFAGIKRLFRGKKSDRNLSKLK